MSGSDRASLAVGAGMTALALLSSLVLGWICGISGPGVMAFAMLLGVSGACLVGYALRRQVPVACGISVGIAALLMLSVTLSPRPTEVPSSGNSAGGDAGVAAAGQTQSATEGSQSEQNPFVPRTPVQPAAQQPAVARNLELQTTTSLTTSSVRSLEAGGSPLVQMTELVGGDEPGGDFDARLSEGSVTGVRFRTGRWRDESGIMRIEPTNGTGSSDGESQVVARSGYALGGINVDRDGKSLRAIQLVFMRVRPDGRLDAGDSYLSDWIGQPTGTMLPLRCAGGRMIGFYGRKGILIRSIGLIFSSAPATLPQPLPGSSRVAADEPVSPFVQRSSPTTSQAATAAKEEPSKPTGTAAAAPLPTVIADALDSTVLVEHSLATGSGFMVAKNIVATNAHVVEGAYPDEITIRHGDENTAPQRISRVLYFDRDKDLCLMQGNMDLKPLPVRSDYVVQSGDPVVLLGNPSVKGGILMRNATHHGTMRTRVHIEGQDLYHIDANVNPGWSGGPGLDPEGRVIAIVVMKANEVAVAEIRGAMQKLDDLFRANNGGGTAEVGIAYGIPGSVLARILEDKRLKDEDWLAATNDRYAAKTLADRLQFLAGMAILRMRINVPLQVRMEAEAYAQGQVAARPSRYSPVKVDYVKLMPEDRAMLLDRLLKTSEVREMEGHFRKDLDGRLRTIVESPHITDETKRDLKAMRNKIKDAASYAENPGGTYAAYSVKVSGFTRDLRQLSERLEATTHARQD